VEHQQDHVVKRLLGLLAAGALAAATGGGLAGDAHPTPDGSGAISRHDEGEQVGAAAPVADPPAPIAGYDESAAAPRVVPAKIVVVRRHSVDSIAAGVLVQRTYRDGRSASLVGLASAVPQAWITVAGDTLRLNAAVQLTSGTRLDANGVQTLEMAGGDTPQSAAFLAAGSGRIQLRGIRVTSVDPTSGHAVAPTAAGRPYLHVSDGGSLVVRDSTIADLGTATTPDRTGRPAIAFARGSTGELTRVAVDRASTGVALAGSQGVRLQRLTVTNSAGDGIALHGDRATALSGVRAEGNGRNGVVVSGAATDRPITGIATRGNRAYGVTVTGQTHTEIGPLTLANDQAGGLEIDHVADSTLHDITALDTPIGVYLHGNSTNSTLDTLSINGARTGVLVEKTTTTMHLTRSTIERAHLAGIVYEGHDGLIAAVTVKDSATAVHVQPRSGPVTIDGLRVVGGTDGIVTSTGAPAVLLKNLSTEAVANDAVRNLAPGMLIDGGHIRGGHTGMDLRAETRVTGTQIDLTATGITISAGVPVTLGDVRVDAEAVGIAAEPGSTVQLSNSQVHGLEAIRGDVSQQGPNDLSLPPLSVLGAIGLPLILMAILLEFLYLYLNTRRARARSREHLRRWRAMAATPTHSSPSSPPRSTTCITCGGTPPQERIRHASTVDLCGACAPR
jgi:hypothetical protein